MLFIVAAAATMFPALWSIAFRLRVENTDRRCCRSFVLVQYARTGNVVEDGRRYNGKSPDPRPPYKVKTCDSLHVVGKVNHARNGSRV